MEYKKPILSICVPTRDRPKELQRMLKTLIPQTTDKVEIIIYDDSEDNKTKKVFQAETKKSRSNCFYIKGLKEGFDEAVKKMINKANGQYVWTFGDDDGFSSLAILRVLEAIKENPDFIWVNYVHGTDREKGVCGKESGFLQDGDEFLNIVGMNCGFLPTLIFLKDELDRNLNLLEKFSGYSWSVLPIVIQIVSDKDNKIYFIEDPLVIHYTVPLSAIKKKTERRGGGEVGSSLKVFGVYVYEIFMFFRNRFKRKTIRNLLKKNFRFLWKGMVVNKIRGWYKPTKEDILTMIKYYWSYPDCWVAVTLLLLPRWIDQGLYKIFKFFK